MNETLDPRYPTEGKISPTIQQMPATWRSVKQIPFKFPSANTNSPINCSKTIEQPSTILSTIKTHQPYQASILETRNQTWIISLRKNKHKTIKLIQLNMEIETNNQQ